MMNDLLLDWESIRSSPRDGSSTSYRLTKGFWPLLLSELFCGTTPSCLRVISGVGGWMGGCGGLGGDD